ncbi:MAG: hypothetical protein WD094_00565 [Balneolaceae bacterium]
MLDKIDKINPWFFIIAIALAIEILFSVLDSFHGVDFSKWVAEIGFIVLLPALKITGYETIQAINEFSGGGNVTAGFSGIALTIGFSMFVVFILTPFLLLKGYQQADRSDDPKQRSLSWFAGAMLIVLSIYPVLTTSLIGTKVLMNINESSQHSRALDMMRSELMDLAFDASYRIFLPVELGGGDGSFHAFEDGSQTISLEDLESYSPDSPFEFQIHGEVSDSSFTAVAVSDLPGKSADFENVNGETGRQQISVEITPYDESIYRFQNSATLSN